MGAALDYDLSPQVAKAMSGISTLPFDLRLMALEKLIAPIGENAVMITFAHFIGMANSVVDNCREMAEIILIEHDVVHPERAHQVNLPTIFGALQGVVLASQVDSSKSCGGCAFRLGTPANQSPSTTVDAEWCANPGEVAFMCHEDLNEKGEPTKGCPGFAQLRKRREKESA